MQQCLEVSLATSHWPMVVHEFHLQVWLCLLPLPAYFRHMVCSHALASNFGPTRVSQALEHLGNSLNILEHSSAHSSQVHLRIQFLEYTWQKLLRAAQAKHRISIRDMDTSMDSGGIGGTEMSRDKGQGHAGRSWRCSSREALCAQ